MRLILVTVAALLAWARCGSLHAPSASIELPYSSYGPPALTYDDQHVNSYNENDSEGKAISYSVLQADYEYLKQYKNRGHSGQYSANGEAAHRLIYNNDYSNGLVNSNIANYDASNYNDNLDLVQLNSELLNGGAAQSHSHFNLDAAPLVTKHIYFHVPPPDVEEVSLKAAPVQPSKKTYNIMFIKVPSYNSRHPVVLQASQQATVEEKTLIYVLAKKPDPPVVVFPPPPVSVSQHEVLYVKYRGEPNGPGAGAAAGFTASPGLVIDRYNRQAVEDVDLKTVN